MRVKKITEREVRSAVETLRRSTMPLLDGNMEYVSERQRKVEFTSSREALKELARVFRNAKDPDAFANPRARIVFINEISRLAHDMGEDKTAENLRKAGEELLRSMQNENKRIH